MFNMLNRFILVSIPADTKTLGNGLALKETRGKRDIVSAKVEQTPDEFGFLKDKLIWFPLYAASNIDVDGIPYMIVDFDDIIMYTDNTDN